MESPPRIKESGNAARSNIKSSSRSIPHPILLGMYRAPINTIMDLPSTLGNVAATIVVLVSGSRKGERSADILFLTSTAMSLSKSKDEEVWCIDSSHRSLVQRGFTKERNLHSGRFK